MERYPWGTVKTTVGSAIVARVVGSSPQKPMQCVGDQEVVAPHDEFVNLFLFKFGSHSVNRSHPAT